MTEPKTAEVKVVPVEPTPEMLNAAVDATGAGSGMSWSNRSPQSVFEAGWSAMLSSTPSHIGEAAGMVAPAQSGWRGMERAARVLVAAVALYEPSMGEDDDEMVEVRLGDLKTLRQSLSAPGSPAEKGEGSARERLESLADDFNTLSVRTKYDAYDRALFIAARDDLREIRALVEAHPASDQSDTERMRAALEWAKDRFFWHQDLTGVDRIAASLAEKEAGQ